MCTGTHPFIPALGAAKVVMYWDTPGGKALNIFHVGKATAWTEAELTTLLDEISTSWDAHMSALQSTSVDCNRMVLTDLSIAEGAQVDAPPTDDLVGENGTAIAPMNVTVATKFTTGFAGRSRRGRSFFVGLANDSHVGDQMASGFAQAISSAWSSLRDALAAMTPSCKLVVVSYCSGGAWREEALISDVTEVNTDNTVDSMRSRLYGRGS